MAYSIWRVISVVTVDQKSMAAQLWAGELPLRADGPVFKQRPGPLKQGYFLLEIYSRPPCPRLEGQLVRNLVSSTAVSSDFVGKRAEPPRRSQVAGRWQRPCSTDPHLIKELIYSYWPFLSLGILLRGKKGFFFGVWRQGWIEEPQCPSRGRAMLPVQTDGLSPSSSAGIDGWGTSFFGLFT